MTTTPNSLGFIAVGIAMNGLSYLPDVTGVREMWLMFMGGVLITVGTALITKAAWAEVSPRLIAFTQANAARRAEQRAQAAQGSNAGGRVSI